MKKIIEVFIILISLICIICPNNVYADSIEEIKKETEFKTVEEDGEPDDYDVLIDAKELISNEKLPAGVKTSLQDVLYDTSGLLNIDFFGNKKEDNSSNKQNDQDKKKEKTAKKEEAIREFVRNGYRIFLYIAAGAMLVVLIYMAVITVTAGISPTLNILPFSNLFSGKKGETPDQHLRAKRLVEQWFKSVLSLVLAVFVMNLLVAFSDNIVNLMEGKEVENEDIIVYVKNSKFAANAPILGASGTTSSSTGASTSSSGDGSSLRQKVVDQASSLENLGASGGWCQKWVTLVYNKALGRDIQTHCCAHSAALSAKNTNSSTDNIIPGAAVFSYRSSGHVIDSYCGMDAGHVGIYIGNGKIASCTGRGSTGITICTIDEWKNSWDFSCWGWLPGTEDLANGAVGDSSGNSATAESKTVDYYFKTNLEGLLMFQSQYNSKIYPLRGGINSISGIVVTIFKAFIYCLLVVRMLLLAGISTIVPLIILIDSFKKIGGGKGFLKNWVKLYMFLLLFRPVVAFFYYALAQSNVYLISEFPLYIVAVIAILTIGIIGSIVYLIRDLNTKRVKNAASVKH